MKPPKGRGEAVLYLDFDGVLHHEDVWFHPRRGAYMNPTGFSLFEHAHLLDDWLRPFPDVRIVLSTSWVLRYGCARAARYLPPGLRTRVIGATFHTRMVTSDEMGRRDWYDPRDSALHARFKAMPRGVQVLEDVFRRQPRTWFALDDDADGWPEAHKSQLVVTDTVLGITSPAVAGLVTSQLGSMLLI